MGVTTVLAGAALAPAASATPATPNGQLATAGQLANQASGGDTDRDRNSRHKGERGAGAVGEPISPEEAFSRGADWLRRGIPYSMSDFTHDRYGKSYRTDCSGFVSMAWHLPRSETTVTLPENTVEGISWDALAPGDAVNRALPGGNGHVMLVTKVEGSTVHVMEQTPPKVTTSVHSKATLAAQAYSPVRYKKMKAVSEKEIREQIEKRMKTLEERINEKLQGEVEDRPGDEKGTDAGVDAQSSAATGSASTVGGALARPAITSGDSPTVGGATVGGALAAFAAPAAVDVDDGTGGEHSGKGNGDLPGNDPLPDLDPQIQPPGSRTLVNTPTIFSVRDEAYTEVIEMPVTGVEVEVYAEQTNWVWHWDDGSEPEPTDHSGQPYPETPRITHTYTDTGTYEPRVDIEWGGYRYRIIGEDEEWTRIEGETTTAVHFAELEAVESQPRLSG